MPDHPLLSVAVVVRDQKDVVEITLSALFELSQIPFELFLINDASIDGSDEIIHSLLDYYEHEHTFFFQREESAGRAVSLNEILSQCNGSLLWAPRTIQEINEQHLSLVLQELYKTGSHGIVQKHHLPSSLQEWMSFISQKNWPEDGSFIWNLRALFKTDQFFNPYIQNYNGLELALRLDEKKITRSDESWYQPAQFEPVPAADFSVHQELLLTLLRKTGAMGESRKEMLKSLANLPEEHQDDRRFENDLLNRADEARREGHPNLALKLIEQVLEEEPFSIEARELKIEILEKKQRFVEASELKHEAAKPQQKADNAHSDEEPEVSLIIPTMGYGKPILEHCLMSVSEHCDTSGLELIIIDNTSLDDTHDYLDELKERQFLNCKVITNERNAGFAASVNQGIDAASGKYFCIMHNDVEMSDDAIDGLKELMDSHSEFTLAGPVTDKTFNPDQTVNNKEETSAALIPTEYIDSFMMMVRADAGLKMDEKYELAFFDDIDFSFQAGTGKVGIAPGVEVTHHQGTTTFSLDLDTESEQYWKNAAYFNEKWDIHFFPEQELNALDTFDQLLALDELVNPLFPEEEIRERYELLFTDELKTEILKTKHEPKVLCKLVHLFMVMDEREVMRRLEDRLENIELPASFIFQLVHFYFSKNIYSRCIHYLDQLAPENNSLRADLYRLSISVENKELDEAIPLLKDLLGQSPANPVLYKLAGDIHKFSGNDEEAHSFYDLAEQMDPFNFANEEKDAFGFEL